ncbi:MAG: HAD family hydrolase [Peptococcaceae bacterium]|nr:MAG: HAD family hydrolase [Peptococcaceae bacterium]
MIKWIIFDAMGVIFIVGDDTNDLLVPFIQGHNKRILKKTINEVYLRASLGQITSRQFWQEVGLGAQYPQIETVYLDTQLILDDGFTSVARMMSKQYSLALLSNDVSEWSAYLRNRFAMDFLDVFVISGDIHCRKPDLNIYKRFLKEAGTQAGECVFIDDRCKNLAVAKSMGFKTIYFVRQPKKSDFVPDASITSFNELENAIENICQQIIERVIFY